MSLGNYSPKLVTLIVAGVLVQGYADDNFIEITQEEDDFTLYKSVDGPVSRAMNADETVVIKVSLAQTSLSNDHFAGLRKVDKATGIGAFPVMLKELNGTTLYTSATAMFKKNAGKKYGKNVGAVDWEIILPNALGFTGGNIPLGL